jgi:hypothetical protein
MALYLSTHAKEEKESHLGTVCQNPSKDLLRGLGLMKSPLD